MRGTVVPGLRASIRSPEPVTLQSIIDLQYRSRANRILPMTITLRSPSDTWLGINEHTGHTLPNPSLSVSQTLAAAPVRKPLCSRIGMAHSKIMKRDTHDAVEDEYEGHDSESNLVNPNEFPW